MSDNDNDQKDEITKNQLEDVKSSQLDIRDLQSRLDKLSSDLNLANTELRKITANDKNNQTALSKLSEISNIKGVVDKLQKDLTPVCNGVASTKSDNFWQQLKSVIQNSVPKVSLSETHDKIDGLKKDLRNNATEANRNIDTVKQDVIRLLSQKVKEIDDRVAQLKMPIIPSDYLKKSDFDYELSTKFDTLNKDMSDLKESTIVDPEF